MFSKPWVMLLVIWAVGAAAQTPAATSAPATYYVFAWPLSGDALTPRGGTSKGAPITLDTAPSVQWQALQAKGISDFERDRRAILAMAGTYRTSFDFLEVLSFNGAAGKQRPYQSWGTEKIYVDGDAGRNISLVHILEMRIQMQDGSISEPIVTKHWRQDWQYEPEAIVEYRGGAAWQRRALDAKERKGRWLQTVYQVDESPRYAGLGTWQHTSAFSSWISGETWRPLPRREWSVRKDYDVLIGTNRHTITVTGWVQEENNLKATLRNTTPEYIAREYGVARYERIKDFSFAEADEYYKKTRDFWNQVRMTWSDWFKRDTNVKLRGQVDQLELFKPLFEQAERIATDPAANAGSQQIIENALQGMRP